MNPSTASRISAAAGLLAVALGAFGAHGLRNVLGANGTTGIWEKAVFYHFIHAVMMFVLAGRLPFRAFAWWSFCVGTLLFSGSLYVLALSAVHWVGFITPIGGVSFLAGWACLALKPRSPASV